LPARDRFDLRALFDGSVFVVKVCLRPIVMTTSRGAVTSNWGLPRSTVTSTPLAWMVVPGLAWCFRPMSFSCFYRLNVRNVAERLRRRSKPACGRVRARTYMAMLVRFRIVPQLVASAFPSMI